MSEGVDRIDSAIGYALGSLTPEEQATYEAHLRESPEARREADELVRVARALDLESPAETPPAGLKERLMAQVAVTPQEIPAASAASRAVASPTVLSSTADERPGPQPTTTFPSARAPARARARARARAEVRWFRRPAAVAAAAAAAVVLFGGGTLLGVNIGNSATVTAQQASVVAQISAAADNRRSTASIAGGGTATLVWSLALGKSVIVVDGLPAAPSGKAYQLWYIRGGQATSAGLIAPHANGAWQILEGTMRSGDTVGMTVEPNGGSKQPTTKPVVAITS